MTDAELAGHRTAAIDRILCALSEFQVDGLACTTPAIFWPACCVLTRSARRNTTSRYRAVRNG